MHNSQTANSIDVLFAFCGEQPIATTGLRVRVASLERGREIDADRRAEDLAPRLPSIDQLMCHRSSSLQMNR